MVVAFAVCALFFIVLLCYFTACVLFEFVGLVCYCTLLFIVCCVYCLVYLVRFVVWWYCLVLF